MWLNNQRGSIAVLVGMGLVGLIGFAALVVDAGALYLSRMELVNMTDAAALAGVQDLPLDPAQAEVSSRAYAAQNGKPGDTVVVNVHARKAVTVSVTRTVELFFAKVFGMSTADVRAQAAAVLKPISGVTGVVPFGVVKQDFIFGLTYTLKVGAGDGYTGNYDALALGGTGSRTYLDNIKYGYDANLAVNQWVSTETGNMSGGTTEGVLYRLNLDPGATFQTVQKGSPRVVVVPVIESIVNDNGRHDVKIVGFAGFFLEGVAGSGTMNYVSGKFMQLVVAGDVSDTITDYGLYGASLVPPESVSAQ